MVECKQFQIILNRWFEQKQSKVFWKRSEMRIADGMKPEKDK